MPCCNSDYVDKYIISTFSNSACCHQYVNILHQEVKEKMIWCCQQSTSANIVTRLVSPLVGVTVFLLTLILRIGAIIEPIIGIMADLLIASLTCEARVHIRVFFRCGHFFRNLYNSPKILKDIVKIALGVGICGLANPECAYGKMFAPTVENSPTNSLQGSPFAGNHTLG